jgi:hypothetical protein
VDHQLTRYWFEFDTGSRFRSWFGVTAWTLDDARLLLSQKVFDGDELSTEVSVIENVDVSTLDEGHVVPFIAPPNERGIWYPRGSW